MMATFNPKTFITAIEHELENEAKRIGEEEISEALKRTEVRLREKLGLMALRLLDIYDVEMDGHRILITVKNDFNTNH